MFFIISDKFFSVLTTTFFVSDGIDVNDYRTETEFFERQSENLNDYHFSYRFTLSYHFQAELEKFSEPAFLRIFVPEKRNPCTKA